MIKRILVALALATSLGGAVLACNTPAGTSAPSVTTPSAPAVTTPSAPAASDSVPSEAAPSVEPSAS